MAKQPTLPKRFQPYLAQAQTQSELRYGAQESALNTVLAQLVRDYGRQSQAQTTAGQTVLGALRGADAGLEQVYTDAGLTPQLRQQIAGSPTGQRLAGELAGNRADVQQQLLGAQQGQQYIQQRLGEQYQDDVGQVSSQNVAMQKERGLYTSSLLDELIGADRASRSAANAAARKQAADEQQAALDRATSTGNALIGQGLQPVIGPDGSVSVGTALPGGKADPSAKPRTTGAGTASPDAQLTAGKNFKKAVALAEGMAKGKESDPAVRQQVQQILSNGRPATQGKVVYEEIDVLGPNGQPTGKKKRQPKLDANGQQVTSTSRPAIPAFDAPIAAAATEQAMFGYVTTKTVRELQKLGYSVNQIPGLKTEGQYRKSRPKDTRNYARPGMAPSRDQQPG